MKDNHIVYRYLNYLQQVCIEMPLQLFVFDLWLWSSVIQQVKLSMFQNNVSSFKIQWEQPGNAKIDAVLATRVQWSNPWLNFKDV